MVFKSPPQFLFNHSHYLSPTSQASPSPPSALASCLFSASSMEDLATEAPGPRDLVETSGSHLACGQNGVFSPVSACKNWVVPPFSPTQGSHMPTWLGVGHQVLSDFPKREAYTTAFLRATSLASCPKDRHDLGLSIAQSLRSMHCLRKKSRCRLTA